MAVVGGNSDVLMYGYVEFKSKHLKTFRKRWLVLYRSSPTRPACLVKYEDEREYLKSAKGRHEYFMSDVEHAERYGAKSKSIIIKLRSDDCKQIVFSVDSEVRADDWLQCILKEVATIGDTFRATVVRAQHVQFDGEVELYIHDGVITVIKECMVEAEIPITCIRKYKEEKDHVFWIETGRKSPMGEGYLIFKSNMAFNILSKLDDHAKEMSISANYGSGSSPLGTMQQQQDRTRKMSSPNFPVIGPEFPGIPSRRRPSEIVGLTSMPRTLFEGEVIQDSGWDNGSGPGWGQGQRTSPGCGQGQRTSPGWGQGQGHGTSPGRYQSQTQLTSPSWGNADGQKSSSAWDICSGTQQSSPGANQGNAPIGYSGFVKPGQHVQQPPNDPKSNDYLQLETSIHRHCPGSTSKSVTIGGSYTPKGGETDPYLTPLDITEPYGNGKGEMAKRELPLPPTT